MSAAREHLIDTAKASPLAGYGYTHFVLGIDWGAIGSFLMAIYAVLLIMDKLGLLAPLKAFFAQRLKKPKPVLRHPEDE